jgi:acetaldehyde dehydrogenase (acetylating)
MVRAAYSSGKPAFGVGPGNVAVLIDTSADIPDAVAKTVIGKAFDFGTVCSSEQVVVAERSIREQIINEFKKQKAYFADEGQAKALEKILFTSGHTVNPACVGQSPQKIAQMAGFSLPPETSIIVCEIPGVGRQHPLSAEKLSPVLAVHFVSDFAAALDAAEEVIRFGGLGHTTVIYAKDDSRVRQFGLRIPAFRVLVNTPAPQGSTGVTTNIWPSMTLGCGAMGGNVTSDNVGPQHLINIKRVAYEVRTAEEALPIPPLKGKPAQPERALLTPSAPPRLDKQAIVAAVEQYLASRGIALAGSSAPAVPTASVVPNIAAQVVDRFLASRTPAPTPAPATPAPICGTCATSTTSPDAGGGSPQASPAPATAPAPQVPVVDFVCEADVRAAIQAKRKIYIGPKTIVTPSAKELAAEHEVLVMAARA